MFSAQKRHGASPITRAILPLIEKLEERRLLSASVGLTRGVLEVVGTESNDTIEISLKQNKPGTIVVNINGVNHERNYSKVREIRVEALNGADRVLINEDNGAIDRKTYMFGGRGRDTLVGGSGPNVLVGGYHNDLLIGGTHKDWISGDEGNDRLIGGRLNRSGRLP